MDTWRALREIEYGRLGASVMKSEIKDRRAVVILDSKIKTKAGNCVKGRRKLEEVPFTKKVAIDIARNSSDKDIYFILDAIAEKELSRKTLYWSSQSVSFPYKLH